MSEEEHSGTIPVHKTMWVSLTRRGEGLAGDEYARSGYRQIIGNQASLAPKACKQSSQWYSGQSASSLTKRSAIDDSMALGFMATQ